MGGWIGESEGDGVDTRSRRIVIEIASLYYTFSHASS